MDDAQFAKFMELIEARFQRLEDRIGGVEDRITGLEHRITGLEHRMGGLEDRMGGLEDRMGGLEDRMGGLEGGLERLRLEMRERFQDVYDRLDTFDYRAVQLGDAVIRQRDEMANYVSRFDRIDEGMLDLRTRVDGLSADMRQRFRVVTDRLAAV